MPTYLVLHRESDLTVDEFFADTTPEERARFFATGEVFQIGDYLYNVYGGTRRPYLYKTLANANRNAVNPGVFTHRIKSRPSERERHKVMVFDPTRFLEVMEDPLLGTKAPDREDDIVIAERQIQLWSERLLMLRDTEKDRPIASGK